MNGRPRQRALQLQLWATARADQDNLDCNPLK